jgi:glucose/arabinose dehydrogenase/azurin
MNLRPFLLASAIAGPLLAAENKEPNRGGEIDLASSDPKVALERFKLQDGYEINLFASEKEFPELAKPVAIAFDDAGRCWVSVMPSYPQVLPGQKPDDKILILEDTNHDGKADQCSTWADGLYMPIGFEIGDGGVYVGLQPNVDFFKDTDGDGKADSRETILHGFGTEDSHHAVHAFQWAPDGGFLFHEGIFHNSQVETPYGVVKLKDAGAFHYNPLSQRLEVFVSYGFANPWGHVFDKWGSNFIADASGGSNYFGSALTGKIDFPRKHPQMKVFTSVVRPTSGCELVSSRQFPDSAQGNFLVTNNIGFQGIKQHRPKEEGSGYTSTEDPPLLQSSDPNFRPVALRFGSDGALYVCDWWNPLIGHMQYSLRDDRRDKQHGRIWRITAKGRPALKPVDFTKASIRQKLDALKEYEDRTRYRARISLRENDPKEVKAELAKWAADVTDERLLLEALWVSQTIATPDAALLKRCLDAKTDGVRVGATRALRWFLIEKLWSGMTEQEALKLLAGRINDEAPRVRLEALLTLSYIPSVEAASTALLALRKPTDYYLDYVLKETITQLEPQWRPVLMSGQPIAAESPKSIGYLLDLLSTADLVTLAKGEGANNPAVLTAALSRSGVGLDVRKAALASLAKIKQGGELDELARILETTTGDAKKDAVQILTEWDAAALAKVRPQIEKLTGDADATIRQAGYVSLLRADRSADRVWQLASASPAALNDLLDATALIKDPAVLNSLYPKIQPLLASLPTKTNGKSIAGRFVRVELPAATATLTLAEVEIFSGGENIARKGKAKQSSEQHDGKAERAIDGRTDGNYSSGTLTHSREYDAYPWWEVDLGKMSEIDRIALWNRTDPGMGKRLNNFKITIFDEQHRPVWMKENNPAPEREVILQIGDVDPASLVRKSAIAALSRIPGHEAATFEAIAVMVVKGTEVSASIAALNRLPKQSWPKQNDTQLAEAIATYAATIPLDQREGDAFDRTIDLGLTLAKSAPNGANVVEKISALTIQSLKMKTVEAQMRYDVAQFFVEAGRPVRIDFENDDIMQHNIVFVKPGAKEEVGRAADALGADAFKKEFIPQTDKILFKSSMLNPRAKEAVSFNAPTEPGDYPYLCTFIGHWPVMHGIMTVVPKGDVRVGKIVVGTAPSAQAK